jgi:NADH:ubiquinone oxidoreductase subunit C
MDDRSLAAGEWLERARSLKDQGWQLTDLCGLDRLGLNQEPRFAVVCQLVDFETKSRRNVQVIAEGEPPTVPSVVDVWPVANFMEREAFDLIGIHFDGHPNLTRILMPDEWEGHPLRKDYGVGKVPIEFVPQPFLQIDAPGQAPDTKEAERAVDHLGQAGPPLRELGNAPGVAEPNGKSPS